MNALTIVMYHYVRDLRASRYPEIKGLDLLRFVEQVHFLNKHYNFVRAEEVIAALNGVGSLPINPVLLSFDDAYIDHYTHVFPILDRLGIQGSFYIPVKAVTDHEVLDVNKIHFILASTQDKLALIRNLQQKMRGASGSYALESMEHYLHHFAKASRHDTAEVMFVKNMLQFALPTGLREQLVDELFVETVRMDQASFSRELYMNTDQILTMLKHGMHVGCHGYNHFWWDKLAPEALKQEVDMSFQFLDKIGVDPARRTACYPYGAHNEQARALLAQFGCQYALTTDVGLANLQNEKRLMLSRLDTNDLPKDRHAPTNQWHPDSRREP